ncbi:MAG: PEP/pyruvate-binding domain-containing protein [Sandaracinaceae bacterium]
MRPLVRRIESIVPRRASGFGGKAKNLAALARAGFPVPAAYAVHSDAAQDLFEQVLGPAEQPAALLRAPAGSLQEDHLARLAERVRCASLPRAMASGLREAFEALRADGALAVAVRSSSTWEDEAAVSAAGVHQSVLGVESAEALMEAVRATWASVLHPTALSYLRTVVGEQGKVGLGLVVQALVPADAAGALFTVNPLSGDPAEMIVNAAYGLGQTVMDGEVSPDTYRVEKSTRWVRDRVLGEKAVAARFEPGRGVVVEEVPAERRVEPVLDTSDLDALISLGLRVEEHFDDARDVEWAFHDGRLYLLQARPVTALAQPPRRSARRSRPRDRSRMVWSNINVGEALPGVATPLTWSVLSDFSEKGFRRAFGALGCTVPRDAELVGNFRGRIYLNLSEFMTIASQVPGLRPRTLLSLGGGGEADRLELDIAQLSSRGFLMRLPVTVARYLAENFRLMDRVSMFEKDFAEERARLQAVDYRILSSAGLDRILFRVQRLLDSTGQIMLTAYGNLLATVVVLRGALHWVVGDDGPRLERELLTGLADVESAAPGLALWHIAQMARAEPNAASALLDRGSASVGLEVLPEGPTRRAMARFLRAYGDRGAREAEIAEPRWAEAPTLPFATLRAHLMRTEPMASPVQLGRRQRAIRVRAQESLEAQLPIPVRSAFRHLLALVQRFTRLRERLRGYTVQVLGLYRAVALDACRRIHAMDPAAGTDAAFFLTVPELHAWLSGDVAALSPLIRRRRLQFARDCSLPDPPPNFVGVPPPPGRLDETVDVLSGLAACNGQAVGPARVLRAVRDAEDLVHGEVLVAPSADVGWSPLFLVASAVVTELGGPLSHAAVVAREYGVPAVVNVPGATRRIQTGDLVQVDGDLGKVRIVRRQASSTAHD